MHIEFQSKKAKCVYFEMLKSYKYFALFLQLQFLHKLQSHGEIKNWSLWLWLKTWHEIRFSCRCCFFISIRFLITYCIIPQQVCICNRSTCKRTLNAHDRDFFWYCGKEFVISLIAIKFTLRFQLFFLVALFLFCSMRLSNKIKTITIVRSH